MIDLSNLFDSFFEFYSDYFIKGFFISILLVWLLKLIIKKSDSITFATKLIKWLLISFSIFFITKIIIDYLAGKDDVFRFLNRATGPYWYSYLFVLLGAIFLPLTLFFKKLQNKLGYLFLIGILINIGWLFESFVIHVTSIHQDFNTSKTDAYFPYNRDWVVINNGLTVGAFILIISTIKSFIFRKK